MNITPLTTLCWMKPSPVTDQALQQQGAADTRLLISIGPTGGTGMLFSIPPPPNSLHPLDSAHFYGLFRCELSHSAAWASHHICSSVVGTYFRSLKSGKTYMCLKESIAMTGQSAGVFWMWSKGWRNLSQSACRKFIDPEKEKQTSWRCPGLLPFEIQTDKPTFFTNELARHFLLELL